LTVSAEAKEENKTKKMIAKKNVGQGLAACRTDGKG
jgi:hypothetical protein